MAKNGGMKTLNFKTHKTMTKKIWCHYIGNDGNTPKRRSIELTPITELLPRMKDCKAVTPLWCEEIKDMPNATYSYYQIYAQLTDKVAVCTEQHLNSNLVDTMLKSDDELTVDSFKYYERDIKCAKTDEERATVEQRRTRWLQSTIKDREEYYARLGWLADFTTYLLSKARWITKAMLRAYEEIDSPLLSTLQALRQAFERQREEERKELHERWRKQQEEDVRKHNEEVEKEQQRLTAEAQNFKDGKGISGEDVVSLCRRYGISVHLRTVHNLQHVVTDINAKEGKCKYRYEHGKRKPTLDGCFKTACELYDYLQEHEAA